MDMYELQAPTLDDTTPEADTSSCQKIKLLKLMEIFRNETDEDHPMLASHICSRLDEEGIRCDRRTLTRDVRTLSQYGYEIMSTMIRHEKAYYVADRPFTIPELKILIDAVHASSFITPHKAASLIQNLANLGGIHKAELLTGNRICFNTRKHSNEQILYNVDNLEKALLEKKKVTFRYFHLNSEKQRVYKKEGTLYTVEPVSLVFMEDNYYLITYNPKHENTVTYRVDRMESVGVTEDRVCDVSLSLRDDVATYTQTVFRMYGGREALVTFQFSADVMDAIYDKFGENIPIYHADENQYVIHTKVGVSPTFWGWLFQFGTQIKILEPASLANEYKAKLEEQLRALGG